jgi:hypothetical protein
MRFSCYLATRNDADRQLQRSVLRVAARGGDHDPDPGLGGSYGEGQCRMHLGDGGLTLELPSARCALRDSAIVSPARS